MTERDIVAQLIGLRMKAGLTQAALAARMGIARPTVARFETEVGRYRTPTLRFLQRYAAAVGARIEVVV